MRLIKNSMAVIVLCGGLLFADSDTNSTSNRYLETTLATGVTQANIDKITGTDIKSNPIIWASINLSLFPDTYNIGLGYSRTFESTDESDGDSGKIDNSTEQMILRIPFDYVGLKGFEFLYSKQSFNSYLKVQDGYKIGWIKTNHRDINRKIDLGSRGVFVANSGQTLAIMTKLEKYELRRYMRDDELMAQKRYYVSIFYEKLTKPWEDEKQNEIYNFPEKIILVYGQTNFRSKGITFGADTNYDKMKKGFSLKSFSVGLSRLDIDLTDHYSFEDKIRGDIKGYKISTGVEVGYRTKTPLFGLKSYLVFSVFGKYNYFYLSDSGLTGKVDGDNLSDDYFYGGQVSFTF